LRGGVNAHPAEWESVAALAGVTRRRLAGVKQVHGRAVRVLARGQVTEAALGERPEADAIVSNEPGLALAVQVADCAPILLADGRSGVAAAVHAGWRGTAAGVAAEAVRAMRALGSSPEDIVVAVGPSIGPCCYEVGDELIDAFMMSGQRRADVDRWFSRVSRDGRAGSSLRLDVALANRDQLVDAGILPDGIYACGLCTQTYRNIFDSYRADGAGAGRMAAVIRVPSVS
jgi:YfiH family protein